jgi:hypothetical protein
MPIRIQSNLAGMRRIYPLRPRVQPGGGGGGGGRSRGGGAAQPGGIDTGSTGNVGGDLTKAIFNTIQQNRQNAAANQILNTQTPPRAGLVDPGENPVTGAANVIAPGTPVTGTPPQTGGMGEFQLRQQMQQQDLADQLQRAKIASELALAGQRAGTGGRGGGGGGGGGGGAGGGNASRWKDYLSGNQTDGNVSRAAKAGKPVPYQAGDYEANVDTQAQSDKFQYVQADFDAKYGKGAYAKIAPNLANAAVDDKGNYAITTPDGKPIMTLPKDQANYWLTRYNAASVRAGQEPLFADKFPSANPGSGQDAGTEVNPYKPTNQLEIRSLPYKKYFVDPTTGQIGQKLPEEKQAAPAGQKTSQVDMGDQGQQAADITQPDQALASAMPQATGGLPQDTVLADAIAQARTANQLKAIA